MISDEVLERMVTGVTLHNDYRPQQQMATELLQFREEKRKAEGARAKTPRHDGITEPGFYWQRDDDNCEWGVNYVSSDGWMTQTGIAERLEIFGQFKGPLIMPEAQV